MLIRAPLTTEGLALALVLEEQGRASQTVQKNMIANLIPSGPPKIITGVDSSHGSYSLQGCYNTSAGGYTIIGVTSSTSMTLEYCASYCNGSPYFAIENGRSLLYLAFGLYAC